LYPEHEFHYRPGSLDGVPYVGTGVVRGPTWVEQMGEALSYVSLS
jgi:hypothetical protein